MPGTADSAAPRSWFSDSFGFDECKKPQDTLSQFSLQGERLTSRANGRAFHVGRFQVLTLEELRKKKKIWLDRAHADYAAAGRLSFQIVVGDTRELHLDPANAGAVFQVTSLFNCLESVPAGTGPESGVSSYCADATQGPAAALACPAATVYRNYFASGGEVVGEDEGGQLRPDNQIDLLRELAQHVDNREKGYWTMRNGFCLPRVDGSLGKLSTLMCKDASLAAKMRPHVAVGIHWETETAAPGGHRVCQIFCSSLPVALVKSVRTAHWAELAKTILEAQYDATLAAAASLAASFGTRVKVFLTLVGGGALGARREWIVDALQRALVEHAMCPLDVSLVHYGELPDCPVFSKLNVHVCSPETKVSVPQRMPSRCASAFFRKQNSSFDSNGRNCDNMLELFRLFDVNGDGVINRSELLFMLQKIDEEFFTPHVVDIFLQEADADANGEIHYLEFVTWLCNEDESIYESLEAGLQSMKH